jgi:hypothetical protein
MSILDNKYNRATFFKPEILDGIPELDLSEGKFSLFETKAQVRMYQLDSYEAFRPDIISYRIYNTTSYWWILMKYNNIIDPLEELVPGLILKVPDASDIRNFVREVKKKIKR